MARGGAQQGRAVAMAYGPAAGQDIVDGLAAEPVLRNYHLLPSVRGELLARLGPTEEARAEFPRAAALTQNARERSQLEERAGSLNFQGQSPKASDR